MARLPSAIDLQRRPAPSETPGIRVDRIDTSPLMEAGRSLSQGATAIGGALQAAQKSKDEVDDYDTRKRLMDFKLSSEMALEDARRGMAPGGAGFAEAWRESFLKQAREFVGEGDSRLPPSQRAKVGLALKQHEVALAERAQRYALTEQDKAHVEGLEEGLGRLRDTVDKAPERRDEMATEGRKLIELSRIPSADKYRLAKKYELELDRTAAMSRGIAVDSREKLEAFRREMRLDVAPAAGARGGRRFSPEVSSAVDTAVAETGIDKDLLSTIIRIESGGRADTRTGSYLGLGQLSQAEFRRHGGTGDIFNPVENARALARKLQAESAEFKRTYGREPTGLELYMVHQQGVGGAAAHMAHPDRPAWENMAGTAEGRTKGPAWSKRAVWGNVPDDMKARFGSVEAMTSRQFLSVWYEKFLRLGGAPRDEETAVDPASPYPHLTLMQRREIFKSVEGEFRKKITDAESEIKHMQDRATRGDLMPEAEIAATASKIERLGDDKLKARFADVLSLARTMNWLYKATPTEAEAFAKAQRARVEGAQAGRLTESQEKVITTIEKGAETLRKAANQDPLTHAHRHGVEVEVGEPTRIDPFDATPAIVPAVPRQRVELERLNFGGPDGEAQLRRRFETARAVGRHYTQPAQYFTKVERDFLADVIKQGGPRAEGIIGLIVRAGDGGDDALEALREVSKKDAPEIFMIGRLVVEGGDPRLISDATREMQRRAKDGDKYINLVDRKMALADVEGLRPGLKMTPGLVDPMIHLADHIYNFRHRSQGQTQFNPVLYRGIMQEIMGQRTDAGGTLYGGLGRQGTGFFDGKSQTPVLVPPMVRQDGFDGLVGALRVDDLGRLGTPRDGRGFPLTLGEVQQATWLSLGGGRYALQVGGDDQRRQLAQGESGHFVLDIRPLLPVLRRRRPDLFEGYRPGMTPEAEPAPVPAPVPAPGSVPSPTRPRELSGRLETTVAP